jgi:restriction system protein
MSEGLQSSTGVPLTVVGPTAITNHRQEIERFLGNTVAVPTVIDGAVVEDLYSFALEKHLEDFLVQNWAQTDLGREYDIYSDEGAVVGQQYPTDTGRIDILAVSKDKKKLLVVELKKGRASDAVVGQILRYMGFVKEQRAEEGQTVHGVIIAHEDDKRIRSALSMTPNILFYRYEVSFKLKKG